jgi:hypothetical protein
MGINCSFEGRPVEHIILKVDDSANPAFRELLRSLFGGEMIDNLYQNLTSRDMQWLNHSGAVGVALIAQRRTEDVREKDWDEL